MAATAEVILPGSAAATSQPVRMVDGARMVVRGAQRLIGAAFALAALGLWLAPGLSFDSEVMLFKLILSLTAIMAGFGLMTASVQPARPEIEVDTIRREVRLVRCARGSKPEVLEKCSFAELSHVEHRGNIVRLWDQQGVFLAEFCLTERHLLNSLLSGLRDEGKLD